MSESNYEHDRLVVLDRENNPIVNDLMYRMRDKELQKNRRDFRRHAELMSILVTYEILKNEEFETKDIMAHGDLGDATQRVLKDELSLLAILRAGADYLGGARDLLPNVNSGLIGAVRDEETAKASFSYLDGLPENIEGNTTLIYDPMIATGGSMLGTIKYVEEYNPERIIIAGVIGAEKGIKKVLAHNDTIKIYLAALDAKLDKNNYIEPGLGDFGDLCFGPKIIIPKTKA